MFLYGFSVLFVTCSRLLMYIHNRSRPCLIGDGRSTTKIRVVNWKVFTSAELNRFVSCLHCYMFVSCIWLDDLGFVIPYVSWHEVGVALVFPGTARGRWLQITAVVPSSWLTASQGLSLADGQLAVISEEARSPALFKLFWNWLLIHWDSGAWLDSCHIYLQIIEVERSYVYNRIFVLYVEMITVLQI